MNLSLLFSRATTPSAKPAMNFESEGSLPNVEVITALAGVGYLARAAIHDVRVPAGLLTARHTGREAATMQPLHTILQR